MFCRENTLPKTLCIKVHHSTKKPFFWELRWGKCAAVRSLVLALELELPTEDSRPEDDLHQALTPIVSPMRANDQKYFSNYMLSLDYEQQSWTFNRQQPEARRNMKKKITISRLAQPKNVRWKFTQQQDIFLPRNFSLEKNSLKNNILAMLEVLFISRSAIFRRTSIFLAVALRNAFAAKKSSISAYPSTNSSIVMDFVATPTLVWISRLMSQGTPTSRPTTGTSWSSVIVEWWNW